LIRRGCERLSRGVGYSGGQVLINAAQQRPLPSDPGETRMEQRFAFVLRIWLTENSTVTGQKVGSLRGTLQSIHSSEPSYFASLRQLNDLIEMALQQDDLPSTHLPSND
jgi:hypothetical protein